MGNHENGKESPLARNNKKQNSCYDSRPYLHAHSWTAYGILAGTETLERFRRVDDGSKEGYAKLELESVTAGTPGKVDLVPPFDIHAEQGGPAKSYGLILRSERVAGKVLQGSYNMETGLYRRIEGPTNVPYELTD